MILGHLVPAGTGFRTYQDSEVRIRPQALDALAVEKESVLSRHFPLLDGPVEQPTPTPAEGDTGDGGAAAAASAEPQMPAESATDRLDELFSTPSEPSSPAEGTDAQ